MACALRMSVVLLLATSSLVVISGEATATVPGAIGRIVFGHIGEDFNQDIYVRDFAGDAAQRVTTSTDSDFSPKWSPDGTRIAWARSPAGGPGTDVYVMDPDGSNKVNVTNGGGTTNIPLDWSPDGTRILIASNRGGQTDLWTIFPDGSNPVRLTNDVDQELDASWSPDASKVAYGRFTPGSGTDRWGTHAVGPVTDLWVMNADGSGQINLTDRPESTDQGPSWSPDGTRIAFESYFGEWNVWVMNADGSNRANLTSTAGTLDYAPAWSPDGTKIAFQSNRDGDEDIWMMNPDGSEPAHLTNRPGDEASIDWESVNRAPIAEPDESAVHRGHAVEIPVLHNDTDHDGEEITVVDVVRMPEHGSVMINPAGTIMYSHSGAVFPDVDSFEYEIEDSRLATARAEVVIAVLPWFDDVPESNTFVEDIIWLAEHDITQGCNPPENTLFCPQDPVSRGQMAAFLVRARNYTDGEGANLFVDDDGSIFESDIDKLGTAGVTRGCNPPVNDRYCPNGHVTRGQMAAFLVRAFGLPDLGVSDLFVDDDDSIFQPDIDKLGATGVSRGCNPPENDRFCPDDSVTRQQMAAFIRRAVTWGQG